VESEGFVGVLRAEPHGLELDNLWGRRGLVGGERERGGRGDAGYYHVVMILLP